MFLFGTKSELSLFSLNHDFLAVLDEHALLGDALHTTTLEVVELVVVAVAVHGIADAVGHDRCCPRISHT